MLLGDGESLLNCRRNARQTETTDSCLTNCSTQNTFCSGVAIFALLRHRSRQRRGKWDCACSQNEHLLFRSMWETYFCVRFDSRNGRLKLLQSFWYTLYNRQDATLHSIFYLETALHVSGVTITHHQERKQLYLQHLVFVTPLLLPAAIAAGSSKLCNVASCRIYIRILMICHCRSKAFQQCHNIKVFTGYVRYVYPSCDFVPHSMQTAKRYMHYDT
jgi:hypothetical protein